MAAAGEKRKYRGWLWIERISRAVRLKLFLDFFSLIGAQGRLSVGLRNIGRISIHHQLNSIQCLGGLSTGFICWLSWDVGEGSKGCDGLFGLLQVLI